MRRSTWASRLYRVLLHVLPPAVVRDDGAEMVDVFEAQLDDAQGLGARLGRCASAYLRLPGVALLEWRDWWTNDTRDRGGGWDMDAWTRYSRVALRSLRKSPAFAVTSIVLVGLGVGAVTTIFTLFDHILLRPLPYPDSDRLITVEMGSHSGPSYQAFTEQDGVDAWAGGWEETANLIGEGDPIRVTLASVTESFFPFFGARPTVGRLFAGGDDATAGAVVVTHAGWETLFGADPDFVGRTVRIDENAYTVIGVLDPSFEHPENIVAAGTEFFRLIDWGAEEVNNVSYYMLEVAGRMAPGVTIEELQPRFDALAERLARAHPDELINRDGEWSPKPLAELQTSTVGELAGGLRLLLGAVGLLLLVACLNVAHLFLARGLGRTQEMSIRRALGARSGGLVQQLLTESLVVAAAGFALGLLLAWQGLEMLMRLNPHGLPMADTVSIDLRIALFAGGLSAFTAVLFGLLPALRTIGADLAPGLRGTARTSTSSRSTSRLRGGLVIAEVALSLVLVAQAGLLLKSFLQVQAHDLGFESEQVWTVPLTPTHIESPEEYRLAMNDVLASLRTVPGVLSAGFGFTMPFEFSGGGRCCWSRRGIEIDGERNETLRIMLHPISEGYFETLGAPLEAGEMWTAATEGTSPVSGVITERLAIDAFGSAEAALGHFLGDPEGLYVQVVGVAPDIKHYGLDQADQTAIYLPMSVVPFPIPMAHMAVRVEGEPPAGLARSLREAVWREQPTLPVPTVQPIQVMLDDSLAGRRFDSAIFGAFGMLALLLAAAGLYGTLSYNVRQQHRELGIRLALGAGRGRVERDVVQRGLLLAVVGGVIGLGGAVWIGRLLQSRLYEVEAGDPIALGGAALALVAAAGLASWLPARRAGRTDPLETLKAE
ncbi:MAG: ADOP family duplicated permease [Gemmatimonadota bacterium]